MPVPEAISQQVRSTLDATASSPPSVGSPRPTQEPGSGVADSGGEGVEAPPSRSEGGKPQAATNGAAVVTGEPTDVPASAPAALVPLADREPLDKWGSGGGIAWLAEYERMARLVAGTVTLPDTLKSPRDILAVAFTGRELGIGFMESTRMIAIIHGRPAIAAELKVKLARQAGHDIRIVGESEGMISVWCANHESDQVVFTMEDAKRAKLVKPDSGYDKYPTDMLWARAVTRLIRRHCPEVVGASMRSVEEMDGQDRSA